MRIAAQHVVTGTEAEQHPQGRPLTLDIEQGRIVALHDAILPGAQLLEGHLLPGYVDTHCHGGAGADFTSPEPEQVARAIAHHRRHGSTTLFASTVTTELTTLAGQLERLRPLVGAGELAGIHLEGPFLAEGRKGAHPAELLCDPTADRLSELLQVADGSVAMVTLAPELEGGLEAVALLHRAGVAAAFGHSDADAEVTRRAVEAGATVATHLFNAMAPLHHREPGPVPVLLHDSRVGVELVCDGVHLAPDVVQLALDAAGAQRVLLVTDAMSATGCPDGDYQLGSLPVRVERGTARLVRADGEPGAIAGSTLTMDRAVAFVVGLGCSLAQASLMASSTPARVHGLSDVGRLEPGCWADACLVDGEAKLRRVMRRGQWQQGLDN